MAKRKVRALVLGATGLVGHYCWRRWQEKSGWTVAGTSHRRRIPGLEPVDILDGDATAKLIRGFRPDLILLAASNPFVDYCEQHPDETREVNVNASLAVAALAKDVGATLVFFSSDYAFDGREAPYGEGDRVCPINHYGRQKVDAERGVAKLGSDHLILRTSGVFGWELSRKNFVLQLVDKIRVGHRMKAAIDVRYNPTYAANLPDVISELWDAGHRGLYHAAGAEEMSRYDFATTAARAFGLDRAFVEPVPMAALKSPTPRPLHSSLRTDKIRSQVRAPLWGAPKGLFHMKGEEEAWKAYLEGLKLAA